ncbi:uncharacterized protein LOC111025635 [Momordica charantia]|uniref:Uncharacterized protein LOC111025635 n=1 Tax=Momordica charantia TaxID=3673 RepID=A0A6J1E392_MOMCH|nr:uncharacterized protein LOC111025635 [Momordica charantia]
MNQVAAIWIEGNNKNISFKRDIVVHAHSGKRHRIQHYFSCYDSLQYPLLFPYREAGWHQNIKRNARPNHDNGVYKNSIDGTSNTPQINSIEDIINSENQGISKGRSPKVSCREYYCYKLQIRISTPSMLLRAGRLFQQYVVDMYIKLETTRLDFYKTQQSHIRSELYQGIVDTVNAGETRGDKVGKHIVLPSTFIGGPRDM